MNVWILSNQDAGRSLSDTSLRELVEGAGHRVIDLVGKKNAEVPPGSNVDLIVAAGGDGTVKRAASLAAGTDTPIGILPLGTANNIATTLGLSSDVPQLIASWDQERRVAIDIGRARANSKEWLVIEGVGGGFIPAGIRAAERELESVDAHPVFEVATAVRVFYDELQQMKPVDTTLTIDGTRVSEPLLMFEVLNMGSVGPNLMLAPEADPSDGLFDVVVATAEHRNDLLAYLKARMSGEKHSLALPVWRARHVRIELLEEVHIDDRRVHLSPAGEMEVSMTADTVTLLM